MSVLKDALINYKVHTSLASAFECRKKEDYAGEVLGLVNAMISIRERLAAIENRGENERA